MAMSSRLAVAAGLSLLGLVGLVSQSSGQQDRDVQKTSTNQQHPAAQPLAPAIIGTVDLDAVFKGYEKMKVTMDSMKADITARQGDMSKIAAEGKQATEILAKLTPGSPDYKKTETRISQLRAQLQVLQEQSQNEFAQREAESLAGFYTDVQKMVAAVAKLRKMTYVVRISKEPVNGSQPDLVMAAMGRPVVYSDPTADITNDVIYYLNASYRRSTGAAAPKASPSAPSPTGGSGSGASSRDK